MLISPAFWTHSGPCELISAQLCHRSSMLRSLPACQATMCLFISASHLHHISAHNQHTHTQRPTNQLTPHQPHHSFQPQPCIPCPATKPIQLSPHMYPLKRLTCLAPCHTDGGDAAKRELVIYALPLYKDRLVFLPVSTWKDAPEPETQPKEGLQGMISKHVEGAQQQVGAGGWGGSCCVFAVVQATWHGW